MKTSLKNSISMRVEMPNRFRDRYEKSRVLQPNIAITQDVVHFFVIFALPNFTF